MAMLPPIIGQILDNFNFDIDPNLSREENTEEVIKSAALLSGAVSIEPLPFADMLILTPLQAKMVLHIGKIYGFDITPERGREIVQELGVTIAYGMAARQFMRGVAKIALPVVGGVVTSPLVYGWTFALGRLAQNYFENKAGGLPAPTEPERKQIVQEAKQQSRRMLPSSDDFNELAEELRRRAEERKKAGKGSEKDIDAPQ